MSMIEKMARAMRKSILIKANEVAELANIRSKILSDEEIERKIDALWPCDVDAAKAALECMKDPTQVMIDKTMASELSSVGCDIYLTMDEKDVKEIYGHMINAALEGK